VVVGAGAVRLAWDQEPSSVGFGAGNTRARKIGIVALARKLLIALWRYLEQGEVPGGAKMGPWQAKVKGSQAPPEQPRTLAASA
jgi:hypothetical protein